MHIPVFYWAEPRTDRHELPPVAHTNCLIWEVVRRAKSEVFKKLDLGEVDAPLSRYEAKFDPILEPFCFIDRIDTVGKTVYFARTKLSWAKKLRGLRR